MRRLILLLAVLYLLPALHAQNPAAQAEPGATTETAKRGGGEVKEPGDEDKWVVWKWANFVVLAGGLVWLTRKAASTFFVSRTENIRKEITEAARLREESEARAAEIERRLGVLGDEIERIRTEVRAEFAHEGERIRLETERHLARIQHQAEQEMEAFARAARDQLRAHAATLALDLAEQRIRTRMDAGTQDRLVHGFVESLEREVRT
jgi:F-type H+-transporting ATPase subunit b